MSLRPPAPRPCWLGQWRIPTSEVTMWSVAAGLRTIYALPRLHPWRLSDAKGRTRRLLWLGSPESSEAVVSLTTTVTDPTVQLGESLSVTIGPGADRWLGGLVRLPGAWLPALAVLPRANRDLDDPGSKWSTESIDFAERHTVHADDTRYAADLLAPHVMALILDQVPDGAAVTLAGDALHVWLRETPTTQSVPRLAARLATAAVELKDAIPSFVLVDHPDRSQVTEDDLKAKDQSASAYRAGRRLGKSTDPTLQRIYDKAQAEWEAGQVSSNT